MWFAVASTLNGAAGSAGSVSNRNLTACLGRAERSCATATPLLGRFICVGSIFSPRSSGYRPVRQCLVGKLPVPGVELVQDSLCARIEHEVQPPRWLYCRLRKNAMMWNPSSLSDRAMSQDGPQAMTRIKFLSSFAILGVFALASTSALVAASVPKALLGDWTLDLESGEPAWMSVVEKDGSSLVHMRVYIGPDGPYNVTEAAHGRIKFSLRRRRVAQGSSVFINSVVDVGIKSGKLDGVIERTSTDGSVDERIRFSGKQIPPMPESPPDLSKVRFGLPILLFNGKDLTGWRPHESDKINGWSAQDGMLVNTTTKTDFSPTGDHANLRTEAEFEDFWLHIEFQVEEQRNSGIYLRGMYEAQVVDRDSRMQGIQGPGAIFGRIAPSTNAGRPGGQWQIYDLTLVDRHVTVVLNGVKVIDNQPVIGPTAGAIYTDPSAPGLIYLQGDHTTVKYRNIYLAPVVSVQ